MYKFKLLVACALMLGACASTRSDMMNWVRFVDDVDHLTPEEIGLRIATTDESYRNAPNDRTRLQLAYLLSRPGSDAHDVKASRSLLEEIDADGRYAALRNLVEREIVVEGKLESSRRTIDQCESEIELLQHQYDDLETKLDRDEERQAELQAMRSKVRALESQLDALKSIEAEMSEGKKAIDDLPDEEK